MLDCASIVINIYMAGDYSIAKQVCRKYCMEVGFCVHINPVDFIYTGGEESGFKIGIINYPRFPSSEEKLIERAIDLADDLLFELHQHSYSIVTPSKTIWFTRRKQD